MALGGEVHDRFDRVRLHQFEHRRAVANVGTHEDVLAVAFQVAQVLEVARVGQHVHVDDQVVGVRAPHQVYVSRTDEPGAAGDE